MSNDRKYLRRLTTLKNTWWPVCVAEYCSLGVRFWTKCAVENEFAIFCVTIPAKGPERSPIPTARIPALPCGPCALFILKVKKVLIKHYDYGAFALTQVKWEFCPPPRQSRQLVQDRKELSIESNISNIKNLITDTYHAVVNLFRLG